jgi:adenine-specific DNA-methyltransferase
VAASVFEEFRKNEQGRFIAMEAIERVIHNTDAQWIILSYSSGGRATADELNQVVRENGKLLEVMEIDYKKNVMAGMKWTDEWIRDSEQPNREFLFLLEKK